MPNNKRLIGIWDTIARRYPDHQHSAGNNLRSTPVFSWLSAYNNQAILEIGIGNGKYSIPFEKNNRMFGIDISYEMLKKARQSGAGVILSRQDCRSLAFKNNVFNVVFSIGVVEHFPETIAALREHFRVCTPGGTIIIEVPHKKSFHFPIKRIAQFFKLYSMGYEDSYTLEEFIAILKETKRRFIVENVVYKEIDVDSSTTFLRRLAAYAVLYTDKLLRAIHAGGGHMMAIKLRIQ